jgi:hypothetical protein
VWIDARPIDSEPMKIVSVSPEVVDYRSREGQRELLKSLPIETMIWAEGPDRKLVNGLDRLNVSPAKILAIWTSPPSPEVFQPVMNIVRPEKVFLFSVNPGVSAAGEACLADPGMDDAREFLERLAGLIKFSITHKDGKTKISELAAACAQTENTLKMGLDWFVQHGQVTVEKSGLDAISTNLRVDSKTSGYAESSTTEIRALLQEASAYRKYFSMADTKSLIP